MKKTLLIIVIALFSLGSFAQHYGIAKLNNKAKQAKIDVNYISQNPMFMHPVTTKSTNAMTLIPIGTSYNIYSILLDEQSQVAYNPDINSVAFVHRQNNGGTGGSGVISFDFSTDGGANWNIDYKLTKSIIDGTTPVDNLGRYPSISFYNPAGNTVADDAYAVAVGPALITGPAWGMIYTASSKLDSTNISDNYFGTVDSTTDFHPYGISQVGDNMWFISTYYDANAPSPDTITYGKYNLFKGVFNSTNNNFDWTKYQTFVPNLYLDNANGYFASSWNLAFAPDGQIGYAVIVGAECNGTLDTVPRPIVWKTTDAGTTWSKLPEFDFSQDTTIANKLFTPHSSANKRPYFSDNDIVVDENGALHMFVKIVSGYSGNVDSLFYTFSHQSAKFLFDCYTTDGTDWKANFISNLYNTDGQIFPATDDPQVYERPQATRTADGSKLFYTWQYTDTVNDVANTMPDVMAIGYSVANNNYTDIKDLTYGSAAEGVGYWQTMSPVCISNGTDHDYELPIVYADVTQNGTPDPLGPPQYTYIKGAGFDESEFPVGIEENSALKTNSLSVYPNPANNNVYVNFDLKSSANVNITISNMVGQTVMNVANLNNVNGMQSVNVDVKDLNAGVYFVNVNVNNEIKVQKLVIQ